MEKVFDIINQENVDLIEFIKNPENIVFSIDDEGQIRNFGMTTFFYPFTDDYILVDCAGRDLDQLREDVDIIPKYFNLEKLGIKLNPPSEDIGILIELDNLRYLMEAGVEIIKLQIREPLISINSATSLSYLFHPRQHGAVSALHCQGGYIGVVFDGYDYLNLLKVDLNSTSDHMQISLVDLRKFELFDLNSGEIPLENGTLELIRDILENPDSFVDLAPGLRNVLIRDLGYRNPMQYPKRYYDIYEREKQYRHLNGFDHLINITNVKIISDHLSSINTIKNNKIAISFSRIQPNFDFIRQLFTSYQDKIVLAGGAALSYYYSKLNNLIHCDDLDLFIHSCTIEEAKGMIRNILQRIEKESHYIYENDTVISINLYPWSTASIKIQIIKRLYRSPSEIIHGFDVDSCCILATLHSQPQIWITERGYYAFQHQVNIVNFDRLSPSYEHRLAKYCHRGFDIWIPFMEKFRNGINLDATLLERPLRGGFILNYYILNREEKYYRPDYGLTNEERGQHKHGINIDQLVFKTLNPNEQAINTFHRIVLQDFATWYPYKMTENIFIPPIFEDNTIHQIIFNPERLPIINGQNLYCPYMAKKTKPYSHPELLLDFMNVFNCDMYLIGKVALNLFIGKKMKYSGIKLFVNSSSNIKCIDAMVSAWLSFYIYRFYIPYSETLNGNNMLPNLAKQIISNYFPNIVNKGNHIEVNYNIFNYEGQIINIPSLKIYVGQSLIEILNRQHLDFTRIAMDRQGRFYTDARGEFAIYEKIHFSSLYSDVVKYHIHNYFEYGYRSVIQYEGKVIDRLIDNKMIIKSENINLPSFQSTFQLPPSLASINQPPIIDESEEKEDIPLSNEEAILIQEEAFVRACAEGHLQEAQAIFNERVYIGLASKNQALRDAAHNGHLDIVRWLFEILLVNIHIDNDAPFRLACREGHLEIAQYLLQNSALNLRLLMIHADNDYALRVSCKYGYLDIVQWLVQEGAITNHDRAFQEACQHGHLDVAQWLYNYGGINIHADDDEAFLQACQYGHLILARWLYQISQQIGQPIPRNVIDGAFQISSHDVAVWLISLPV